MGDDRPIRYADADGTIVYRASGLGACDGVILGLAAGRKPNNTPAWLQEVYDEGIRMEGPILTELVALDAYSHLNLDQQTEWEMEVGEINGHRIIVRGHSDGWDKDTHTIVEAKKFRDSTWPKFTKQAIECNTLYPWQVSVYMWAAAQAGYAPHTLFVGGHYDKEHDAISEIGVFDYADPPISIKAIRKRIARWENMIADSLDVTDLTAPCSTPMFPCAMFGKGCPNETDSADTGLKLDGEREEIAVTIAQEMERQAGIAKTAETMLAAAKKRKKELEDGLRALHEDLIEAGITDTTPKKMLAGGYTLTHVNSQVPEKVVKGYTLDYFKLTAPKGKP